MPQHIGVVACSAEGAALCYRTICNRGAQLLGPHSHPEISMHSHSLSDYMGCIYRDDWEGVGELMLRSARKLAMLGADFLICPDNTIHAALPAIEAKSPLPWLHIAQVVASEAVHRKFRCMALTGTQWLVEGDVYTEAFRSRGLELVRPNRHELEEMNRIIMDELVAGIVTESALAHFQKTIERLKARGCDAVILGCTEIPLMLNESNSPLPVLDSTRLLAEAALRRAVLGAATH